MNFCFICSILCMAPDKYITQTLWQISTSTTYTLRFNNLTFCSVDAQVPAPSKWFQFSSALFIFLPEVPEYLCHKHRYLEAVILDLENIFKGIFRKSSITRFLLAGRSRNSETCGLMGHPVR